MLNLTNAEKDALVAFLGTLTGTSVYTDPKWSSPFDENNELSFVVLPTGASVDSSAGTMTLRAKGVPRVTYLLKSSANMNQWDDGVEVTANEAGELVHEITGQLRAGFFCFVYRVAD